MDRTICHPYHWYLADSKPCLKAAIYTLHMTLPIILFIAYFLLCNESKITSRRKTGKLFLIRYYGKNNHQATMTIRQAELLLLLATVAAATGWLLTSFGLQILPPYQFLALRFLIAGAILGFFVHPSLKKLTGQQCWRSFVVGVALGVALLFWIMGLAYTEYVGAGAFIASLSVIFVPIIGRLFFAEKITIYLVPDRKVGFFSRETLWHLRR